MPEYAVMTRVGDTPLAGVCRETFERPLKEGEVVSFADADWMVESIYPDHSPPSVILARSE